MEDLLQRLRDQPCDRAPFTPEHAECVCRLTNAAADEIERLLQALRDGAGYRGQITTGTGNNVGFSE